MDSNPGGVGLLGSVERCFELRWWHVAAVAVEPVLVEPVHPGEGGEFGLVDVVPAVGVGPVDALRLAEAVGGLGQGVDAPIEVERYAADARLAGVLGSGSRR